MFLAPALAIGLLVEALIKRRKGAVIDEGK